MAERIHDPWENNSVGSLGTAAAFKNDVGIGTLFLKDGEYNTEFLQNFVTKPLKTRQQPKIIRDPVLFTGGPKGYKNRTIIYFKDSSIEEDPQQREKFHVLSGDEVKKDLIKAREVKREVFLEKRKLRKAWNTPVEQKGSVPKPPDRVTPAERKARKAKAMAEAENHGALVEAVMVPDSGFGAGEFGKRMQIQPIHPPKRGAYNPDSYTPRTDDADKSTFVDENDENESHDYFQPPSPPVYENSTPHELRLLTAARTKSQEADMLRRKVTNLEKFVGGLKQNIETLNKPLKEGEVDPNKAYFTLGENTLLGTKGGELAAALNELKKEQLRQSEIIAKLGNEKKQAERQVRRLEKEILNNRKYNGSVMVASKDSSESKGIQQQAPHIPPKQQSAKQKQQHEPVDKKTSAFLERQEEHLKKQKDHIAKYRSAEDKEANKFNKFKAKEIVPGEMASKAEELREVDAQKAAEREVLKTDRKLESEFLSGGPSMLEKERLGVKTTSQKRGEDRREKERKEWEKREEGNR